MLYRHAVPRYYAQWRQKVYNGEIPVCKEVAMEMARIDALVENPAVYYDPDAVEGFIEFCENELTLTDGSELKLLETFKLWAEEIFGWWYFEEITVPVAREDGRGTTYVQKRIKHRLVREQFLIVGRSAAKTLYVTCIQAYFLVIDPSTTIQVTTAYTMSQADEVLGPFRTALTRARGPYFKMMTEGSIQSTTGSRMNRPKIASTKKGIENFITESRLEIRPMSVDKLQGSRGCIFSVDEWLSSDVREDIEVPCLQSASKTDGGFVLFISSEGTVRNSVGDNIKMKLRKLLVGEMVDPSVSIWWYKLDDEKEIADPSTWLKANPNLGATVSYEVYEREREEAMRVPLHYNDIIAKRFGLPMEGYTYFFTYEDTLPTADSRQSFWQMPCSMGIDLSLGDDFCSFTFLFPLQGQQFGIRTLCFISEYTLHKRNLTDRQLYEEFMAEGSLRVLPGSILDMDQIYDEVTRYIDENGYTILSLGYDPYNSKAFIPKWEMIHGPFGVEKVPQGMKTETVPLGELKKLAEQKLLIFNQQIITYCMSNCIALEDNNGNRKLTKRSKDQKIDVIAALVDAFVAYKVHKERFAFE